jgi:serine/threonine protein kinase
LAYAESAPVTFQWVKGELLGEGTYARVYLALNATTGEIMAVKQVELSRTASDLMNSRHQEIIDALDSERKTLMELDHINIVQYLGYEESSNYLSMYEFDNINLPENDMNFDSFLEYVPGGTISSCLQIRGEGFPEDTTKSFAGQILAGLAYLHSKRILHRVRKYSLS